MSRGGEKADGGEEAGGEKTKACMAVPLDARLDLRAGGLVRVLAGFFWLVGGWVVAEGGEVLAVVADEVGGEEEVGAVGEGLGERGLGGASGGWRRGRRCRGLRGWGGRGTRRGGCSGGSRAGRRSRGWSGGRRRAEVG